MNILNKLKITAKSLREGISQHKFLNHLKVHTDELEFFSTKSFEEATKETLNYHINEISNFFEEYNSDTSDSFYIPPEFYNQNKSSVKNLVNINKELQALSEESYKELFIMNRIAQATEEYIDKQVITELRLIKDFDTYKLVKLCEEINFNYEHNCFFAIAALLRTLLDHVPPIFQKSNFSEVVNNYRWLRSEKKNIAKLESELRNVSDVHLHSQIKNKVRKISKQEIDFRSSIATLLSEIVRLAS